MSLSDTELGKAFRELAGIRDRLYAEGYKDQADALFRRAESESVVIEVSGPMRQILDAMVATGLFGPSRDTAAQRLLEQKLLQVSMETLDHMNGLRRGKE